LFVLDLSGDVGARKGIMMVFAIDGHSSVVTAAMLGRADVWNAMVMAAVATCLAGSEFRSDHQTKPCRAFVGWILMGKRVRRRKGRDDDHAANK
jgi:hypothetical protein